MIGLILAAGLGNRMMPLTGDIHKTLLEINNTKIIDRIINSLLNQGIEKIFIVTGYRANELKNHICETFPTSEFHFIHNDRFAETNNIFSLALVFENYTFEEDVILIESDLIYEEHVLDDLINSPFDNVALLSPYCLGMDGTVVQVNADRIVNIFPPHLQDEKFDFSDKFKTLNIYKFSKEFCNGVFKNILLFYSKRIDDTCYYELILGILIYMQRMIINCVVVNELSWAEVDDPNDLNNAEFVFNKSNRINLLENSFGGYWNYNLLDFCFIRNMYFPTDSMMAEFRNNLPALLRNYGSKQDVLNRKLSYVLNCNVEGLVVLNGAAQVYPILQNYFLNNRILIPEPTFGEYNRVFSNLFFYGDVVGFDLTDIESKIIEVDVVVLVTPNNPTGSVLPVTWIQKMICDFPEKYFIVDESFIEFSDQDSIIGFVESKKISNVIVIRSMSKSYGLPGIRLGFIYTLDFKLRNEIIKNIPIWNLNSVAEFYLEIILKNKKALADSFEKTKVVRIRFIEMLKSLDIVECVYNSHADFILFRIEKKSELQSLDLSKYLISEHSIFIKEVSNKFDVSGFSYYRVAVRSEEDNNKLIEAMKTYSNFK